MRSQPVSLSAVAEFLHLPVAIDVAGCNQSNRPSLARGLGCRVLAAEQGLCLFLSRQRSQALLDDLQTRPKLAAVFCLPSTEQAIQIKGVVTGIRPASAEEHQIIEAYRRNFALEVAAFGYSAEFVACYRYAEDCVTLIVTPQEVYEQTPGPLAGSHLTRSPS